MNKLYIYTSLILLLFLGCADDPDSLTDDNLDANEIVSLSNKVVSYFSAENGPILRSELYTSDDSLVNFTDYEYDASDRHTKTTFFNSDSTIIVYSIFSYNDTATPMMPSSEIEYGPLANILVQHSYTYTMLGNLLTHTALDSAGARVEYDSLVYSDSTELVYVEHLTYYSALDTHVVQKEFETFDNGKIFEVEIIQNNNVIALEVYSYLDDKISEILHYGFNKSTQYTNYHYDEFNRVSEEVRFKLQDHEVISQIVYVYSTNDQNLFVREAFSYEGFSKDTPWDIQEDDFLEE